jgi:hypothetical protein
MGWGMAAEARPSYGLTSIGVVRTGAGWVAQGFQAQAKRAASGRARSWSTLLTGCRRPPTMSSRRPGSLSSGCRGMAALLGKARLQKATPPVPEQATQSVKADINEIREKAHG